MSPPPLLGYNNNVRHRGRIFHIQTEDSGVGSPRIKTHLFADGGRIVKSTRTDYSEYLGQSDMVEKVKHLMKEQHKAMFVALRSGTLDHLIGFSDEPESESQAAVSSLPLSSVSLSSTASLNSSNVPSSTVVSSNFQDSGSLGAPPVNSIPASGSLEGGTPGGDFSTESGREFTVDAPESSGELPRTFAERIVTSTEEVEPSTERPYAAPRPAAIFSATPTGSSIFGDVGLDEKSLDDAILSYLAEDPKKKE